VAIDISKLMSAIVQIRNASDRITTSGHENRELLSFIYNGCNDILNQLGKAMEDIQRKKEELERKEESSNETHQNFS